ncbi:MAG: hypothetical protein ISS25_03065 [Nanoarchaeota archaeon]|nr:hypothetical protein [DPANN group archaeon]MBL7116781.1 hypothetical protein [Nanoarchaeota archaeon]
MSSEGTSKYTIDIQLLPAAEQYKKSGTIDFSQVPIDAVIFLDVVNCHRLDHTDQRQEYPSHMKNLYHHPNVRDLRQAIWLHNQVQTESTRTEIERLKNHRVIQSIRKTHGLLEYILEEHNIPHV